MLAVEIAPGAPRPPARRGAVGEDGELFACAPFRLALRAGEGDGAVARHFRVRKCRTNSFNIGPHESVSFRGGAGGVLADKSLDVSLPARTLPRRFIALVVFNFQRP